MTPDQVWSRIQEAVEIERILPDIDRPAELGNAWPDIVRSYHEGYGYNDPVLIETATGEQIARCNEVMGWFRWTSRVEKTALLLTAKGAPDKWIAKWLHYHPRMVEKIRRNGIRRIVFQLTQPEKGIAISARSFATA